MYSNQLIASIVVVASSLFVLPSSFPVSAHQAQHPLIQFNEGSQLLNATQLKMDNTIALGNNTGYSFFPQLAMSDDNLYVIWMEGNGLFGGYDQNLNKSKSLSIVYRTSSDNGTTFDNLKTLSNFSSPNSLGYPAVMSDANGSRVYVAWTDNSTNDSFDVHITTNTQNGTAFEKAVKIPASQSSQGNKSVPGKFNQAVNNATSESIPARIHQVSSPQIAVSTNDRVYLIWTETLALLVKAPNIPSFPQNLTGTEAVMNASGANASNAINPNSMQDFDYRDFLPRYNVTTSVYFTGSNDSGKSFAETKLIHNSSQSSTYALSSLQSPTLVASGGNVYMVTATGSEMDSLQDSKLLLYRSSDNGTSFEEKSITTPFDNINANGTRFAVHANPVVTNSSSDSLYMLVTVAQNKTESIVKAQGASINRYLPSYFDLAFSEYFMRSDDAGANFTKPIQVVNHTRSAMDATMVVSHDGSRVYLAWSDPGLDLIDIMLGGLGMGRYVSPEKLEELNTAGSTLVRASNDNGNTFGEVLRLNASKPTGGGLSFGGNAGSIVPLGDSGLLVIKTRTSYGGPTERVFPSSELLLWVSRDGASSFEGPFKVSGSKGDLDFGLSAMFGGNSALLGSDALYVAWSGADYGNYYDSTVSSEILLRRIK